MIDLLNRIVEPTSKDLETANRQRLLNIVILSLAIPGFLFGLVMLILWLFDLVPPAGAVSGLGVQPFYALSYWLNRRNRTTLAAYIPATVVFVAMFASLFAVGIGHVSLIGFAMVITTAGVLIGARAAILFTIFSVGAYWFAGFAQQQGLIQTAIQPETTVIPDAVGLGLGLVVLVALNWLARHEMTRALSRETSLANELQEQRQALEAEVQERTEGLQRRATQLQTTTEIAKLATEVTDPEMLMAQAIEFIRERFGFYHASIFTMDETGTWAELAASTGAAGKSMMARSHRLAVGSASIIGWVTANRLPRLANDVDRDPFHFKNPLLPETNAELAVPLIVGQRLLGALDVQSQETDAFSEDDVRTLEAIASELSIAIDSARMQREMRQQLDQIERTYRGRARDTWGRLARSEADTIIHIGHADPSPDGETDQFQSAEEASTRARTVLANNGREVAVPVMVRGEVIATIAARKPRPNDTWSDDEITLLESVTSQTAMALESARQRSEEQRRVSELEVLNRISQAVSQMLRLDSLYRVVHSQINQVLGETDIFFSVYNQEENTLSFPYASERGELLKLPTLPLGRGLTSLVIKSRQPLMLVEDVERRARELGAEVIGRTAKSWLGVPLLLGDDVIGVICVQDTDREERYSEDDAALLSTIASQISAAIQNTRLLEQVQQSARRERLIHEISSRVRRSADMKTILETTARELGRALNASRASVRIGKTESEDLASARGSSRPDRSEDSPAGPREEPMI
jgi:GAF domain-containing protein